MFDMVLNRALKRCYTSIMLLSRSFITCIQKFRLNISQKINICSKLTMQMIQKRPNLLQVDNKDIEGTLPNKKNLVSLVLTKFHYRFYIEDWVSKWLFTHQQVAWGEALC